MSGAMQKEIFSEISTTNKKVHIGVLHVVKVGHVHLTIPYLVGADCWVYSSVYITSNLHLYVEFCRKSHLSPVLVAIQLYFVTSRPTIYLTCPIVRRLLTWRSPTARLMWTLKSGSIWQTRNFSYWGPPHGHAWPFLFTGKMWRTIVADVGNSILGFSEDTWKRTSNSDNLSGKKRLSKPKQTYGILWVQNLFL